MIFSGKNVVLVGGCGGIGLSTSHELLKKKIANLIIVDCVDGCAVLADLQKEYPDTTISFIKLDITNKKEVERVYNQIFERLKCIDILINCAGVLGDNNVELTINVNLLGLINSTLTMFNLMDKSQGGHGGLIVNIASVLGLEPFPSLAIYTASKHGVVGFSRCLGSNFYFDKTAVKVITICPGFTKTPLLGEKCTFTFPYGNEFKMSEPNPIQTADECAQSIMEVIKLNKNGSVWICETGKHKEVNMTKYWLN